MKIVNVAAAVKRYRHYLLTYVIAMTTRTKLHVSCGALIAISLLMLHSGRSTVECSRL